LGVLFRFSSTVFELGVLAKKRLGEASGQSTQAVVSSKLIEVAKGRLSSLSPSTA
jgi:hypothetical protein